MNKNIQQLALGSIFALACTLSMNAQVVFKVGTNPTIISPSTAFEVESANKGVLLPRVALTGATDATTILAPTTSMLVYNTATAGTSPNNVTPGYYYWTGTAWTRLTNGTPSADWTLTGNAGTVASTNFIGTTDAIDFVTRTNNTERMRINTNGRVGIGVVPNDGSEARLQVNSNYSKTDVTRRNLAILGSNDATNAIGLFFQQGGGASTANRYMSIDAVESGVSPIPLILQSNGNVGIGTTSPIAKLHVENGGLRVQTSGATTSGVFNGNLSNLQIFHPSGTDANIRLFNSGGSLILGVNGTGAMVGNIGIGTTTPTTRLHIDNGTTAGAIRIVDGTQGAGKVLTSDANGVGSWKVLEKSTNWINIDFTALGSDKYSSLNNTTLVSAITAAGIDTTKPIFVVVAWRFGTTCNQCYLHTPLNYGPGDQLLNYGHLYLFSPNLNDLVGIWAVRVYQY